MKIVNKVNKKVVLIKQFSWTLFFYSAVYIFRERRQNLLYSAVYIFRQRRQNLLLKFFILI